MPDGTIHPLIQTARGLCTDEADHRQIDRVLARALDAATSLEHDRDDLWAKLGATVAQLNLALLVMTGEQQARSRALLDAETPA